MDGNCSKVDRINIIEKKASIAERKKKRKKDDDDYKHIPTKQQQQVIFDFITLIFYHIMHTHET